MTRAERSEEEQPFLERDTEDPSHEDEEVFQGKLKGGCPGCPCFVDLSSVTPQFWMAFSFCCVAAVLCLSALLYTWLEVDYYSSIETGYDEECKVIGYERDTGYVSECDNQVEVEFKKFDSSGNVEVLTGYIHGAEYEEVSQSDCEAQFPKESVLTCYYRIEPDGKLYGGKRPGWTGGTYPLVWTHQHGASGHFISLYLTAFAVTAVYVGWVAIALYKTEWLMPLVVIQVIWSICVFIIIAKGFA